MISINKEKHLQFLLNWTIIVFFSYDFIVKILFKNGIDRFFYDYAVVFKAIFIIIPVSFVIKRLKIDKVFVYIIVALSISYLIGQLTIFTSLDLDNILFNGHYFLNSVLSIAFIAFILALKPGDSNIFVKSLLAFLTINSIIIFLGFYFEIEIFNAYIRYIRFGYSGLLLYHSELGYIYFLGLLVFSQVYKKSKSNIHLALIVFNFVAAIFLGTKKAIFLAFIFSFFFLFENRHMFKSKIFNFIWVLMILIFLAFRKTIVSFFLDKFKALVNLYEQEGLVTFFFSYRNILFEQNFLPYMQEKWYWVNYIFGGPSFSSKRIELEFFDIFLFFGFVGTICYVLLFVKLIKKTNKRKLIFGTFAIVLAATLSGNLISSLNVMVLYSMVYRYLDNDDFQEINNEH